MEAVDARRVVDDGIVERVAGGEDRHQGRIREVRAHGRRINLRANPVVAASREDVGDAAGGELAPVAANCDEGFVEENRLVRGGFVVEFAAVGFKRRRELHANVVAVAKIFSGANVNGGGFVAVGHHAGASGPASVVDLNARIDEAVNGDAFLIGGGRELNAAATGKGRAGEGHGNGRGQSASGEGSRMYVV